MILAILAAGLVATLAADAAPATAAAAATPAAEAVKAPAEGKASEDAKLVCTTERATGSHRLTRVCYRKADKETQDFMRREGSRDVVATPGINGSPH